MRLPRYNFDPPGIDMSLVDALVEQRLQEGAFQNLWGESVRDTGDIARLGTQFIPRTDKVKPEYDTTFYVKDGRAIGTHTVTNLDTGSVAPRRTLDVRRDLDKYGGGIVDIHNHPKGPAYLKGSEIGSRPSKGDLRYHHTRMWDFPEQYYGMMIYNDRGDRYSFVPTKATPQEWIDALPAEHWVEGAYYPDTVRGVDFTKINNIKGAYLGIPNPVRESALAPEQTVKPNMFGGGYAYLPDEWNRRRNVYRGLRPIPSFDHKQVSLPLGGDPLALRQ